MKVLASILVLALVAGCGGGSRYDRGDSGVVTRFSTGPISRACLSSDRKARNSRLCGCIQTVANGSLSGSDQRKAARFFRDPQRAMDVKMSKTASDDAFWERYERFAARSEQSCRGY
ncbi:hypothetical protein [Marivita geojedonensis]|uniref:Arginine transporter n=1 Tax=Marivita geojedonensis TaxID=1123756 RepID=A0A1X4NM15_9RHOB|nr:hypothetical protein [Marivita geojedonensis]OSQ51419.1 hypothetical protein MGEO_08095 [Marivita geojedonensis]PRY77916.1 hypothetical protein CLV76_107102 [Marivita geojedonensis]